MNRNRAWTDVVDNSVAESGRENQGRGGQFDEFLPQARKSGTVVQQGTACAGSDPQMVTDSAPLRFGFAEHQDANISLLIVIPHEALPLARSSHVCLLIRYPRPCRPNDILQPRDAGVCTLLIMHLPLLIYFGDSAWGQRCWDRRWLCSCGGLRWGRPFSIFDHRYVCALSSMYMRETS